MWSPFASRSRSGDSTTTRSSKGPATASAVKARSTPATLSVGIYFSFSLLSLLSYVFLRFVSLLRLYFHSSLLSYVSYFLLHLPR